MYKNSLGTQFVSNYSICAWVMSNCTHIYSITWVICMNITHMYSNKIEYTNFPTSQNKSKWVNMNRICILANYKRVHMNFFFTHIYSWWVQQKQQIFTHIYSFFLFIWIKILFIWIQILFIFTHFLFICTLCYLHE